MLSQLQLWNIFAKINLEKNILTAYHKVENETFQQAQKLKCRVLYDMNIQCIEFHLYETQILDSLEVIESNQLDYHLKYADRAALNLLTSKSNASDVLMVKNGLISDISYANVAFGNGKGWFTPRQPLLKGTKRQFLLEKGLLKEMDIKVIDLQHFNQIMTFNAMMEKSYFFSSFHNDKSISLQLTQSILQ